jgi:acyl transferase domain-containing protein
MNSIAPSSSNLFIYSKLTSNERGSIKANIGHLEGSSGPAGVVKAVMMLERGIIPPQALFKTLNPAIDAAGDNIKVHIHC